MDQCYYRLSLTWLSKGRNCGKGREGEEHPSAVPFSHHVYCLFCFSGTNRDVSKGLLNVKDLAKVNNNLTLNLTSMCCLTWVPRMPFQIVLASVRLWLPTHLCVHGRLSRAEGCTGMNCCLRHGVPGPGY